MAMTCVHKYSHYLVITLNGDYTHMHYTHTYVYIYIYTNASPLMYAQTLAHIKLW